MGSYWDDRFRAEGMIWGENPSKSVAFAIDLFNQHELHTVLVPGSGYGRNSRELAAAGFSTFGVEISPSAMQLAAGFDPATQVFEGTGLELSHIDWPFQVLPFDSIYCFNVLHLFQEAERSQFLTECANVLREGGLIFCTVFSERDPSYGKGNESEPDTFESKPGRPVHYFTEDDLRTHFTVNFLGTILKIGEYDEPENHGAEGSARPHFALRVCTKGLGPSLDYAILKD